MNQKEIIKRLQERGIEMSVPLIYRSGLRFGFLVESNGKKPEKYTVDEDKFSKWLDEMADIDSSGWVPVSSVCHDNDIEYASVKYHICKLGIEVRKMGFVRGGVNYVRREDAERIVRNCGKRSGEEKLND